MEGEEGTQRFGKAVGSVLQAGDIIGLVGDLGAGKTTLTRSIALGANVPQGTPVNSPTFTIMNLYKGQELQLCHLDFYRLESAEELEGLGLEDLMGTDTAFIVEWWERFDSALSDDILRIDIEHIGETSRRFSCRASGEGSRELLEEVADALEVQTV